MATTLKLKEGTIYRTFQQDARTVVAVSFTELEGREYLTIRKYWDAYPRDGVHKHQLMGQAVRIPWALVPDLLAALVNVVGEVDEDLLDDIR